MKHGATDINVINDAFLWLCLEYIHKLHSFITNVIVVGEKFNLKESRHSPCIMEGVWLPTKMLFRDKIQL